MNRTAARSVGIAVIAIAPFIASSGVRAQKIGIEVRGGLVGSTALAEDLIAGQALLERLGARFDGSVRAVPAASPIVVVAAHVPLRGRFEGELAAGWTFGDLRASDRAGDRSVQGLDAGHALIGVRYQVAAPVDVAGGFGILRYFSDESGLFADGADLAPLVEGSVGVTVPGLGGRVVVRAVGQAHRFNTPALRFARAADGTVLRGSVQAGIRLGGAR